MNLFGHLVVLLGRGIGLTQGFYLHRKTRTHIHASSRVRTHDRRVRAAEDSTCLRQPSFSDMHFNNNYPSTSSLPVVLSPDSPNQNVGCSSPLPLGATKNTYCESPQAIISIPHSFVFKHPQPVSLTDYHSCFEVLRSNLGSETGYPALKFLVVLLSSSWQITLEQDKASSFHILSNPSFTATVPFNPTQLMHLKRCC
jgi:hypothetical protein